MKKTNNKKGISLIVLVITIIVMIVLAAAIILSLTSSGIVGRANEAKVKTDIANAKQVVAMATAEWELDEQKIKNEDESIQSFTDYANKKLTDAGYKVGVSGGLLVSETGMVNTIYIGSDNKRAIIPEGFTVSSISTEDTVTEGLVIYEGLETVTGSNVEDAKKTRNQYVWVPVEDFSKFQLTTTYNGDITKPDMTMEPLTATSPCITDISLHSSEINQYNAMRKSVEEYGGFYIARYEAGLPTGKTTSTAAIDGSDKPRSVFGATAWTDIPWDATWSYTINPNDYTYYLTSSIPYGDHNADGVPKVAKQACDSSSVISHLIYGVEWDAALQFIYKTDSSFPTVYDNTKGYFSEDVTLTTTGYYSVCNIYDMAGNACEWTYEAIGGDPSTSHRVVRSYYSSEMNPSSRYLNFFFNSTGYPVLGFRVALYLK